MRPAPPSWRHLILAGLVLAPAAWAGDVRTIELRREVVNLERFAGTLVPRPDLGNDVWSGAIPRRQGDVAFLVEFRGPQIVRARADRNLNGDLTDEGDLKLSIFPGEIPARSFLVEMKGTTGRRETARLARVVVPSTGAAQRAYRVQDVHGMLGTIDVDGRRTLALLFDGDADGLYTTGTGDGVFLDLDGDRHFPIDIMAPEFGAFGAPFTVGGVTLLVDEVAADGSRLVLRAAGAAAPPGPEIEIGTPVPDLVFIDTDGRPRLLSALRGRSVIVWFWSSGCETCHTDAPGLRSLYARYAPADLEILGVSYDVDRQAMERFRQEHGHDWPTSFHGGVPSLDPIGRSFREKGTGVYYLIDAGGRLAAKVTGLAALHDALIRN